MRTTKTGFGKQLTRRTSVNNLTTVDKTPTEATEHTNAGYVPDDCIGEKTFH